MGIALFTLNSLTEPLHCLARWLAAHGHRDASPSQKLPAGTAQTNADIGRTSFRWTPVKLNVVKPTPKPLRVVRIVEASHGPTIAGRMVISGRMADVCAELDRLATLEAAHC